MIGRLNATYIYRLNISVVDYLYETGFCWAILLTEYWIVGTFLLSSRYIRFQNHPQRRINICIWIIPLTENISSILHTIYLLADLIISAMKGAHWGRLYYSNCCEKCILMQTWLSPSQSDIFHFTAVGGEFHSVQLNFQIYAFLASSLGPCQLTSNFNKGKICNIEGPKKEAKETMKTKAHKAYK